MMRMFIMQLTNNLFLHHLTPASSPVQFFKNNADHRSCRSAAAAAATAAAAAATAAVVGQFLFPRTMASFCKNSELSMMTDEAKKKGKASLQPATRPLDFARRYCI